MDLGGVYGLRRQSDTLSGESFAQLAAVDVAWGRVAAGRKGGGNPGRLTRGEGRPGHAC